MADENRTAEQLARDNIDAMLELPGWDELASILLERIRDKRDGDARRPQHER